MHVRKGDQVVVIAGKEKGKRGRVLRLLTGQERVVIERVNLVKRHTKPNARNQQGGIVEKEAPLFACKVMPVDPKTGKPTRVKVKVENGTKTRIAKSGAEIRAER